MTLRELNQMRYLAKEIRFNEQRLRKLERSLEVDIDDPTLYDIRKRIAERIRRCTVEWERIERYVDTVDDSYIRIIMTLRFVDGLSWRAVAAKVGGGNTDDSVKKAVYRYLSEGGQNELVP